MREEYGNTTRSEQKYMEKKHPNKPRLDREKKKVENGGGM